MSKQNYRNKSVLTILIFTHSG